MTSIRKISLIAVMAFISILTFSSCVVAELRSEGPCGIFVLDSKQGPNRNKNIRHYDFVKGYAWRMPWDRFESRENEYDFSALDNIVSQLEAIHQKLSFAIQADDVPSYVLGKPGVTVWESSRPRRGATVRAVPWDPYLMERFERFMGALAEHEVFSEADHKKVPFKDHPILYSIKVNIPGLGALREYNRRTISRLPGYEREKFKAAVLKNLHASRDHFPHPFCVIGFWKITDDNPSPPLYEEIRKMILNEFDGVKNPKIGFFQENLAASKDLKSGKMTGYPNTNYAEPLYLSKGETYIEFQALQGWNKPFSNPEKTKFATPMDGMQYAFETYGTRYFELYITDLDDRKYWNDFRKWASQLCSE